MNTIKYFNTFDYLDDWVNFLFVVGGRGTGKSFNTLSELHKRSTDKNRYVFVRRTKDEILTMCKSSESDNSMNLSPFKEHNAKFGWGIYPEQISSDVFSFHDSQRGIHEGYIIPLSTVGKVKGASYYDVDFIFFDEFIPLSGQRNTRFDGDNFIQLYETIARNREFEGRPPLKAVFCANAATVANSVFLAFDLVNEVSDMKINGISILDLNDRGIRIVLLDDDSDFKEMKKETALYKALKPTSLAYRSALNNDFTIDDFTGISPNENLSGYKPRLKVSDRNGIYTILQREDKWYITNKLIQNKKSDKLPFYDLQGKEEWRRLTWDFSEVWLAHVEGRMKYSDMYVKVLIYTMFNKKYD